jgi:hypothetical protein
MGFVPARKVESPHFGHCAAILLAIHPRGNTARKAMSKLNSDPTVRPYSQAILFEKCVIDKTNDQKAPMERIFQADFRQVFST